MKPTRLQFGVRENTTPSRQHASRRVNRGSSNVVSVGGEPIDVNGLSVPSEDSATVQQPSLHAAPLCAATGENGISEDLLLTVHEVAELLRVPVSWSTDVRVNARHSDCRAIGLASTGGSVRPMCLRGSSANDQ